jgi:hypothetical protein
LLFETVPNVLPFNLRPWCTAYDQIEVGDEMHKQLRAFIRLGHDIDFSNINHNLMKEVKKRLGTPLIATSYNEIKNTKFCPSTSIQFASMVYRLLYNHHMV